jgi:hypothetical protein
MTFSPFGGFPPALVEHNVLTLDNSPHRETTKEQIEGIQGYRKDEGCIEGQEEEEMSGSMLGVCGDVCKAGVKLESSG